MVFNTLKNTEGGGKVSRIGELSADKELELEKEIASEKLKYNLGVLPIDSILVTSPFGKRKHPITGKKSFHSGVDLRAKNKDVKAVQNGIVIDKGYDKYLGQYLKLRCGSFVFVYGHLKYIYVKKGQFVDMDQLIGRTGGTGRVTADHLHFAIKKSNTYINPLPILNLIFTHN